MAVSILDRFRPVGAPGAAGSAGGAETPATGPAAELAPVFALVQSDLDAAARTVARARARAADSVDAAAREAEVAVQVARDAAVGERASASARVLAEAGDVERSQLATARAEADRIRAASTSAIPGLVAEALDRMRRRLS